MTGGQNPKPTPAPGQWDQQSFSNTALLKTFSIYRCFMFPADSHCDNGYLLYRDFCYHFETETVKSWQDAEDHCTSEQGHLVSFHSEEELSFLTGIVQNSPTGISLWMGGHDAVNEGGWEWTDGSPFRYVRWAEGNPDDYFGEDCLSMYINDGYWNDDVCEYKRGYICKKRGEMLAMALYSEDRTDLMKNIITENTNI
uniref:C-type lectin domain-containing protein n=1 Tax=Cynoglossus semilaevis TaxID=244447 RepID=A0A3P8UDU9_CYNSE